MVPLKVFISRFIQDEIQRCKSNFYKYNIPRASGQVSQICARVFIVIWKSWAGTFGRASNFEEWTRTFARFGRNCDAFINYDCQSEPDDWQQPSKTRSSFFNTFPSFRVNTLLYFFYWVSCSFNWRDIIFFVYYMRIAYTYCTSLYSGMFRTSGHVEFMRQTVSPISIINPNLHFFKALNKLYIISFRTQCRRDWWNLPQSRINLHYELQIADSWIDKDTSKLRYNCTRLKSYLFHVSGATEVRIIGTLFKWHVSTERDWWWCSESPRYVYTRKRHTSQPAWLSIWPTNRVLALLEKILESWSWRRWLTQAASTCQRSLSWPTTANNRSAG